MTWTSHQAASTRTRNDPSGCASGTVPQIEWTKSRGTVTFKHAFTTGYHNNGFLGALAELDLLYHLLVDGDACINARNARNLGRTCTAAATDAAATASICAAPVVGIRGIGEPAAEDATVDVGKFSDYVFKEGATHGKDAIFRSYGYGPGDSQALADEFQAQGAAEYRAGLEGQGAAAGRVTTINTGWMIEPNGSIRLLTPFAGFAP